jgi:hypothetical protein
MDAGVVERHDLAEQGFARDRTLVMVVRTRLDQAGVAEPDHAGQPAADQQGAAAASHAAPDRVRLDLAKPLKKLVYDTSPGLPGAGAPQRRRDRCRTLALLP